MNHLEQSRIIRAEKQRKHKLYKQILDEQIRYKNQQADRNKQKGQSKNSFRVYDQQRLLTMPQTTSREERKQEYKPHIRHRTIERDKDEHLRTEQYLNNCEDIIHSLRELKNKRQQLYPLKSLVVERQEQRKYEYLRPTYRQKMFPVPGRQTSLKFIDNINNPRKFQSIDSANRKNGDKQTVEGVKKRLKRVRQNLSKHRSINNQQEESKLNPQLDSKGIRLQSLIKKNKLRQKTRRQKMKIEKNQRQKDKLQQNKQDALKSTEMHAEQSGKTHSKAQQQSPKKPEQLKFLINQLTKYLQHMNSIKKQEKMKEEEMVKQTEDKNIEKAVKEDQIQQNMSRGKVQHPLRTLIALRKIKDKGKQLVKTIQYHENLKKQPGKTEIRDQNQEEDYKHIDILPAISKRIKPSLHQSRNMSPALKSGLHNESSQKTTENIADYSRIKEEEILSILLNHMHSQQQKNEELTYCLKQLTEFMKNQSESLQMLSNTINNNKRDVSQEEQNNGYGIEDHPQNYESNHKGNIKRDEVQGSRKESQDRLKEAFVNRLKTLKMRGILLNQTIQTYKKSRNQQDKPSK